MDKGLGMPSQYPPEFGLGNNPEALAAAQSGMGQQQPYASVLIRLTARLGTLHAEMGAIERTIKILEKDEELLSTIDSLLRK